MPSEDAGTCVSLSGGRMARKTPPNLLYTTVIEFRCKEKEGKEPDCYTKVQA